MAFPVCVFVFLLVVCLFLSLALLWRLDWFSLRPSSSGGGARRTTLHRLLKPHSPDDCPACRLSCTNPSVVGPVPAPVRPWCEVKSRRGAPTRVNTEGYACPNQQCAYFGLTDSRIHASSGRWHAWACRAHPDVSLPGLPYHVHFQAQHCPVPSENPFSPDRRRALCTGRRAGPFGCRTGLRLSTSHHHHLAHSRRRACTDRARTLLSSTPDPASATG
jgi:hypothetical protein